MIAHRVAALALVLVLSACSGGQEKASEPLPPSTTPTPTGTPTPTHTAAPTPSRQLVAWTGAICAGVGELIHERTKATQTVQMIKEPGFASLAARSYLISQPAAIRLIAFDLAGLQPSGNAAADRLTAQYNASLGKVVPKVAALAGNSSQQFQLGEAEQVRRARQIAALIVAVRPAGPELAALIKSDPMVGLASRQSAPCKKVTLVDPPAKPLPAAADGQNYRACADGNCVVLVKKSAKFTVKGKAITVTVANGEVSISNREADGGGFSTGLKVGGSSGWGTAGAMTSATLAGLNGTAAVLQLTTK